MKLTTIVVDDEKIARRRIARLIRETDEAVVVAECGGGRDAVTQILEHNPQIVFLDVQMPDMDGFQVIEAVGPERMPPVVFVTAFDDYALRAFDLHAVDYLLKPYDTARFRAAFSRAKERVAAHTPSEDEARLRALLEDYVAQHPRPQNATVPIDRIGISAEGSVRVLKTADVDWWETEGNYVRAHVGGASHLVRMTAARLESQLDPASFVRIHRRYLVNMDRVAEVQPWFSGDAVVILKTGAKLRLSRSYRDAFHGRLFGKQRDE